MRALAAGVLLACSSEATPAAVTTDSLVTDTSDAAWSVTTDSSVTDTSDTARPASGECPAIGVACSASGAASIGECSCGAGEYFPSDRRFLCCIDGKTSLTMCVDGVYRSNVCGVPVTDSGGATSDVADAPIDAADGDT